MNYLFSRRDMLNQLRPRMRFISKECKELFKAGLSDPWSRRQDKQLDRITGGYRNCKNHDEVIAYAHKIHDRHRNEYPYQVLFDQVGHRWLNGHTHDIFLEVCLCHPRVKRADNPKDPDKDIIIDDEYPFDPKCTNWPGEWDGCKKLNRFERAITDPTELVHWYYKNQSEGRWNWQPRLFWVGYDAQNRQHLKLKYDFDKMESLVFYFLDTFEPRKMIMVDQEIVNGYVELTNYLGKKTQQVAYACVIWNYKEPQFNDWEPRKVESTNGHQLGLF